MGPSLDQKSLSSPTDDNLGDGAQKASHAIVASGSLVIVEADPFNLEELDFGKDLREQLLQVLTGKDTVAGEITLPGDEFSADQPLNLDQLAGTEAEAELSKRGTSTPIESHTESVSSERKSKPFEDRESSAEGEIITRGQIIEEVEEVRRVELTIGPSGISKRESIFSRPKSELKLVEGKVVVPRSDAA